MYTYICIYKLETLVWRLMQEISSEQANVIRTWPLQSPSDDLSFVVT